jgi:hypothetical protein
MASAAAIGRRGSTNTERLAAKQRRQKILVGVLVGVLAALLAYQLPHMLGGSSDDSAAGVPTAAAPSIPEPVSGSEKTRVAVPASSADPFAAKSLPNDDAHAVTAGGPDPFTRSSASPSTSVASRPAASPTQIVIGRPGAHKVAKPSWIVVLASIPAANGRPAALSFARKARKVGGLSILNSSTRASLRGGYWVVYSGPYGTLQTVTQRAGKIRAAGYGTAYVREVLAYR